MAAPASQPTQPPHKATWVVEAWRQRGLISDDVVSTEQLTELHANSWFARRNRRSPHTAHPPPVDGSGWLARRNRKQQRAAPGVRRQASRGLEVWVKAKLPQGVQPMRARAATSPALMRPEGAAVKPVNESLGSSTESLPGSGRDRSPSSLAMPGVPLGRLEPLERDDGPRPQVELTLYDLCTCCNQAAHLIGVGVYHTGIVVEGLEYTYDNVALTSNSAPGDTGVVAHAPYYDDSSRQKLLPFRSRVQLGRSRLSARASHALLRSLASVWIADEYDLVEHNCHHWCFEAAAALGVAPPPPWVSRAAEILKFFSGLPSEQVRASDAWHGGDGAAARRSRRVRIRSDEDGDESAAPLLVRDCAHFGRVPSGEEEDDAEEPVRDPVPLGQPGAPFSPARSRRLSGVQSTLV